MHRRRRQPGRRPMAADLGHRAFRVAAPRAAFPGGELRLDIGRALAGDGGDAGPAFAGRAMTGRAGARVERAGPAVRGDGGWQRRIVSRHRQPLVRRQRPGDGAHLRVGAHPFDIMGQLADQIAFVETGEARAQVAVALALQPVARHAGVGRAGIAARQGDQLAALPKAGGAFGVGRASGERNRQYEGKGAIHCEWNRFGETAVPQFMNRGGITGVTAIILALAACKPAPGDRLPSDPALAAQGKAAIERAGCAACHTIPGVDWPKGRLGPSLEAMDDQGLIAGTQPNTPDNLAAFIRDAPAVKPGSLMPAMPVSEAEARAIAHYLIEEGR